MDELSELQARIHARQVQRQLEADIVDNARRDDSPGQFGDATNTPGGLTRSRSEFDNGQLDEDEFAGQMFNQIYTVEMGRTYKRHKGLSAEADADAEKFVKTPNVFEQNFMIYVATLQNRDMLRGLIQESKKNYKIPDTLKKTAQDYAAAAILSPSIYAYRSDSLATMVLDAMRELNVADIPPKHETGRCDMMLACIGKALTDMRCSVKSELVKSVTEGENKRDVATLTKACIGTSKAKPTAALYMRIAFLRGEAKKLKSSTSSKKDEEQFWKTVDNQLENMRKTCVTPAALLLGFEIIYDDDKELYGQPDGTLTVSTTKDLDEWLTTLNSHSASAPARSA